MKILKGTVFQPNSVKYLKTSLKEYLESVKECYQAQRGKNNKKEKAIWNLLEMKSKQHLVYQAWKQTSRRLNSATAKPMQTVWEIT